MGLLDQAKEKYGLLMQYIEANTPKSTRPVAKPGKVFDDGLLGGAVSRIPGEANRLIQRAKAAPAELNALASPEMAQQVQQAMSNPQPANKQQWMDAGMELSGMAPLGGLMAHTVYHGSPHKFDKFDMSKIGTGEGAQAYGHGLYFAESPDVAMKYAPRDMGFEDALMKKYKQAENSGDYVSMQIYEDFLIQKTPDEIARYLPDAGYVGEDLKRAQRAFNESKKAYSAQKSSALYKVDIPDESIPRMLDWDKPLNEQSPQIHDAMKARGISLDDKYWHNNLMNSFMGKPEGGSGSYDDLNKAATEYIKAQGIPGIRYLDGNSRGAGGTSNFVLFDDQLPRILEVNGQPTGLLSYADEAAKKTPKKKK